MSIIHACLRWALGVVAPGTGRRRAAVACPAAGSPPGPRPRTATAAPQRLPVRRSPYGLHGPLDGGATVMVRPYVVESEREEARQARRRLALVLAADFGIDLDGHVVGAEAVA
ncbi:hypothetical protein F9278_16845 [Streptomyces phaeolivaceus]|uniref:Uncharacterized protein n=1 Tax=Streptomyces phaeolivaceus TaxID=2653200 RepID=A0A5P8K2W1_9ACTN|nr:hypothetical protein [Streptomyces phaeolivaceus]QFQ97613.1 hypothetical protein F9278_16845 [Streptomyces phaeolivaceus]